MPTPSEGSGSGGRSCSPIVVRDMQNPEGRCRGDGQILEIAFSGDGRHLLMGAKNFAVRVWDVHSGEVALLAPPLVRYPIEEGKEMSMNNRTDYCTLVQDLQSSLCLIVYELFTRRVSCLENKVPCQSLPNPTRV